MKLQLARNKHFKRGAEMDDDNPLAYEPAPGDKPINTFGNRERRLNSKFDGLKV